MFRVRLEESGGRVRAVVSLGEDYRVVEEVVEGFLDWLTVEILSDILEPLVLHCAERVLSVKRVRDEIVKAAIQELFDGIKHRRRRLQPGVYVVEFDRKEFEEYHGVDATEDNIEGMLDESEALEEKLYEKIAECIRRKIETALKRTTR